MSEIQREETTTHKGALKVSRSQLLDILCGRTNISRHLPQDVWPKVKLGMDVPGGGDWSYTFLEIGDNDDFLLIHYEYQA